VFNRGRVEQVGSPSEIYESPATAFVAGFVGVSNLIGGEVARAIRGSTEMFSVRPEKIHIVEPDGPVRPGACLADGRVRDVVYLGLYTRYLVELDAGADLVVVQQNLNTTSMDVLANRGRRVRLLWDDSHNRPIATGQGAAELD
jgi:putative spermidine/putrescine transport system ATP-binding protein